MTKLEKIEEIIREYENGSDADATAEDIIEGIKNTLDADDRYYDRLVQLTESECQEVVSFLQSDIINTQKEIAEIEAPYGRITPDPDAALDHLNAKISECERLIERFGVSQRTAPTDEIDFDKELIFDSLSLESEYFGYSAEPYLESENSISWALTVNSNLERIFIERGGYNKEQLAASVGDEYIEGLNPLDYDDIYAEHYLVVDKDKNITIENQVKRSGEDVTTCGVTVLSPSESKAFCAYINKYLAQFNGKSIDSYLAESDNLNQDKFEIRFGELIKYTGSEEHVVVPDGVDQIGKYAFKDSRRTLKSVVLPDSIRIINDGAFEYCINLEHITLSKNTEYIGRAAFADLHSLKEIELPDGLKKIAFGAFQSCPNLTGINIPESVQSIGNSAFFNCGITSVSIPAGCDCDATAFDRSCNVTRRNSEPKQTKEMKV